MIKEITINDPITYEGQPDGGQTPMIDPYDGCQFRCPYCFQLTDVNWNKDIYVNTNIADLLMDRLATWTKTETIFFGSRCDPYMQLEEKYGLTRKCLEILNDLKINTMITTKSDNDLIFRDIDIMKSYNAEITVLMGISNINQVDMGLKNKNIINANKLYEEGIKVWAFITPVLPHIMDVEGIIDELNPDIPVFLDKLRIMNGTIQEKMSDFINKRFPEYKEEYKKVIYESDEEYYNKLVDKYSNDERIKILF